MNERTETISGDVSRLVRRAQAGDQASLAALASEATVRLRSHVYRMTLREDVTQDVVQETILEMIRILDKLRKAESFWPWLYGISLNKLRRYRRTEGKHDPRRFDEVGFGGASPEEQEGLESLLAQELKQMVSRAMQGLKPRHRAILSMRCYDEMSYAQIAEAMDCSAFAAQMLFCRAKRSLAKQLSKQGLRRGSLALGLVVFGKMTAATKAAAAEVSVGAAALETSLAATAAAVVLSKAAATSVAVAAVATGAAVFSPGLPAGDEAGGAAEEARIVAEATGADNERSDHQSWFFLPAGAEGPVMLREMARDEDGRSWCRILQNDFANYYYDRRADTVYVRNYHWFDPAGAVMQLPTDAPALSEALRRVQPESAEAVEFIPARSPGLLVIANHDREDVARVAQVLRHDNVLEEEYFQYPWAQGARVVDERDAMHADGRAFVRVSGLWNGSAVRGTGYLPLNYHRAREEGAWLEMDLGAWNVRVAGARGQVYDRASGAVQAIDAASLLAGWSRPWMGLHCVDSVRRDGLRAQLTWSEPMQFEGDRAVIQLHGEDVEMVYTIDWRRDLVERIEVEGAAGSGVVRFEYLPWDETAGREFRPPGIRQGGTAPARSGFWLADVVGGRR